MSAIRQTSEASACSWYVAPAFVWHSDGESKVERARFFCFAHWTHTCELCHVALRSTSPLLNSSSRCSSVRATRKPTRECGGIVDRVQWSGKNGSASHGPRVLRRFFHIARSSPATSAHFEALNRRRAFKPADLPPEIRKRTPAAENIEIVVSRRYDSTLLDFADSLDWANAK